MECLTCRKDIPDDMKATIAMNVCPYCGQNILKPQQLFLKNKISQLIVRCVARSPGSNSLDDSGTVESLSAHLAAGLSEYVTGNKPMESAEPIAPQVAPPAPPPSRAPSEESDQDVDMDQLIEEMVEGGGQEEAAEDAPPANPIFDQVMQNSSWGAAPSGGGGGRGRPVVPDHLKPKKKGTPKPLARADGGSVGGGGGGGYGPDFSPAELSAILPGAPGSMPGGNVNQMTLDDMAGLQEFSGGEVDDMGGGGGLMDISDQAFFNTSDTDMESAQMREKASRLADQAARGPKSRVR